MMIANPKAGVERPTTNASLAAAVALFIQAEEQLQADRQVEGYYPLHLLPQVMARYAAFTALKNTFETEFPK